MMHGVTMKFLYHLLDNLLLAFFIASIIQDLTV